MNFRHRAAASTAAPGGGIREDCWTESATAALVEAWGDRFLLLSRGNLRQKDWKDVADSVNSLQDASGHPRKTSGQCKNRIDTLKKKYKLEKSKPGRSSWPFFSRLDLLVGASPESKRNPNSGLVMPLSSWGASRVRTNPPDAAQSSRVGSGVGCGASPEIPLLEALVDGKRKRPWGGSGGFWAGGGVDGDFGELARAVERIGEVYERVERSKLRQTMEMERQRMEFEKDVEIRRMKVFVETQVELQRMKRHKYDSDSGKRS